MHCACTLCFCCKSGFSQVAGNRILPGRVYTIDPAAGSSKPLELRLEKARKNKEFPVNMRIATVSVISAALVATGATAAVAAPAEAPAPKATITLKASATKIKLGDVVTFTGRTAHLKEGSKVTLQIKDGAKWVSLPASSKVNRSAYKLTDKFQKKGVDVLRVKDGSAVSKPVSVTVR